MNGKIRQPDETDLMKRIRVERALKASNLNSLPALQLALRSDLQVLLVTS